MSTVERELLTREELRAELDRVARERLGLGVDEFLEQYAAARIDLTSPRTWRAALLARLLLEAEGEPREARETNGTGAASASA